MANSRGLAVQKILLNTASTNITSSGYVQLDSALNGDTRAIEIFNGTGEILFLATGASGSEVDMNFYILPGGNGLIDCQLYAGQRLAVKSAVTATVSSGYLALNLYY